MASWFGWIKLGGQCAPLARSHLQLASCSTTIFALKWNDYFQQQKNGLISHRRHPCRIFYNMCIIINI